MEDRTPLGSQEARLSSRPPSIDRENPVSSPVLPSPGIQNGSKPRKAPTITPRTFTRFFTPKSSLEKGGRVGASRQALREITACASNCRGGKTPTNDNRYKVGEDAGSLKEVSKKRKRKIPDPLDITPDRSSPLKRIRNQSLGISEDDGSNTGTVESEDEFEEFLVEKCQSRQRITKRIDAFIGSKYCGELGRELRQESGIHKRTSRPGRMCDGIGGLNDWQYETTSFFTRPEDAQVCMNVEKPSDHTIPFCIASCNSKYHESLSVPRYIC